MAKKNQVQTEDIETIREKIKTELQEGDLVKIMLKEHAIISPGVYHAIILDQEKRESRPGQLCIGYVGYIDQYHISLKNTWNMPNSDSGNDVFYSAITSWKKYEL